MNLPRGVPASAVPGSGSIPPSPARPRLALSPGGRMAGGPGGDRTGGGRAVLWIKALHLIFMVTWFAGLFYLPRLFVYHALAADDPVGSARFKVMERKLYWGITTPGGILTLVFGVWLLVGQGVEHYRAQGWLHAKLALVASLVVYHLWCGHYVKRFAEDRNPHGHVYYRWFNEYPVLVLIGVVILAVVRPF
jgi:putative membrane protein